METPSSQSEKVSTKPGELQKVSVVDPGCDQCVALEVVRLAIIG